MTCQAPKASEEVGQGLPQAVGSVLLLEQVAPFAGKRVSHLRAPGYSQELLWPGSHPESGWVSDLPGSFQNAPVLSTL